MNQTSYAELTSLSKLIDLIYQGAVDAETWGKVPRAVGEWMEGISCLIFTPLHPPEHGGFMVTHNLSPQTMELWASKYYVHDIWAQRALERHLVFTGNVMRDQDLITEEEFLGSAIWQDFLAPLDIGRLVTGIVFSGEDHLQMPVICTCHRPFGTPYTEQDAEKLRLILPHLSRALGVMLRLRDAEFRVAASLTALDRLPNGILLFNADGEVTFANQAASRILAQEDGLRLHNPHGTKAQSTLLASNQQNQALLNDAIREALNADIYSARHFSHTISIARPSGKAPFTFHFSSLSAHNEFGLGDEAPRAIAFLADSASPLRLNVELLKATYGLTVSEIRAAEHVANGDSVEEAARKLNVSVNTVKTQLAQLYDKTGTHNRAKLVKLLLAFAM